MATTMNCSGILLLFLLVLGTHKSEAAVSCQVDDDCETIFHRGGAICDDGQCTNPFYKTGCIRNHRPDWPRLRICNSDEPPEAAEMGFCRPSPLDYMEIRALSQNWESSIFITWVFQIFLSEMLDIPVSVEAGQGYSNDFYSRESRLDYGRFDTNYQEITTGSHTGDCRDLKTDNPDEWIGCAHTCVVSTRSDNVKTEMEKPSTLGALGTGHWFVPKYTVERDPTLVYYLGLSGEHNRRKMAETFPRPTTWKEYCEEVSVDHCENGDEVALRPPEDSQAETFHVPGSYNGYFRYTADNDCNAHPLNCTGHIAEYPCTWKSFTLQQLHHLGIALKPNGKSPNGGYTYGQLQQIYRAANATKTDVIMMAYTTQPIVAEFRGSDAELSRVVLPPPTQKCEDARIDISSLCGDDQAAKVGSPDGVCDYPDDIVKKVVARNFHSIVYDPDIPEALWSPAYQAIENFRMSTVALGLLFQWWFELGIDKQGFDGREAACRWVVENLDTLQSYIPESYPRVVQEEDGTGDAIYALSIAFAGIAILVVLVSSVVAFTKRSTKTLHYTQVPFVFLLLWGSFLVAVGALVKAVPPSDVSCTMSIWFTDLGYVLQLVPLVARLYAINGLSRTGTQMQRVVLDMQELAKLLLTIGTLVCIYLVVWTSVDAPQQSDQYELTKATNEMGDRVVTASQYCGSDEDIWLFLSLAWQGLLILPALVLAFTLTSVIEDLNDTKLVSLTLSTHFIFIMARAIVFGFGDDKSDSLRYISILLSADTIASTTLYLWPKFLNSGEIVEAEILPDLFLDTTIMMASIEGFAAWSSVREPVEVFKYLEAVFEQMDVLAERYKIYKVETTGECYGIPDARSDHAVVMARFASDCVEMHESLSKKLEVQFGPDTCDLTLQVGMHSGPVTGGFMKRKHSRFQLFGDSMTTTSLIHDTGDNGEVHMSEETANLLIKAGRKRWTRKREPTIRTMEKGEMQTYWLTRKRSKRDTADSNHGTNHSVVSYDLGEDYDEFDDLDTEQRWVEFNVKLLSGLVTKIAARRGRTHQADVAYVDPTSVCAQTTMPLLEVKEIIDFPEFDQRATKRQRDLNAQVQLEEVVIGQLRELVTQIAGMYLDNPFHNFAHASYVVMAVTKYMNRIVAAHEVEVERPQGVPTGSAEEAMHDHTYGITSDPLTQFACVFAALVHDIDHPGVPNAQLVKEGGRVQEMYKNRSISEQKSLDLAWDLFVDPTYNDLRRKICSTEAELRRFRQLIVNCVMATDLMDDDLKALRNGRWGKAFGQESTGESPVTPKQAVDRKATIVIEHLIQAADVAHTCQHWKIYQKWNQRLFEECYRAYRTGRAENNPADNWYKGEIAFLDYYVIPLSKKLRDCGVFGPTSDENLNYAENNRAVWVDKGEAIVDAMLKNVEGQLTAD